MSASDIVLSNPVRTAIGGYNGSFKDTPATELGAAVLRETVRRTNLPPEKIGSVIFGNVIQAGNKMNPARQASIGGGLPVDVPAMTVNRVCGSGAQAIVNAALEIAHGDIDIAVAGGMENMDRAPYLMTGGRWGYRMGKAEILDSMLSDGLLDAFSNEHSGWHTEDLVTQAGLTRAELDSWALRSQQRFTEAQKAGKFDAEILGIEVKDRKAAKLFNVDEAPRADTSLEGLAALKPAFRKDGHITAGNSPGLNSGAAAMIVSTRAAAEKAGFAPMARLVAHSVVAVEPGLFGLGPIPAVRKAADRAGWKLSDIERIEINEAFAAVPLAVSKALGLPHDIVNVEGGAVAHGHPIGATGAVLTTRLLHSMKWDGLKRGVVTLCIGGGQGIALVLEML